MPQSEQLWLEVEEVCVEGSGKSATVRVRFRGSLDNALESPGPWIDTAADAFDENATRTMRAIDKARRDGFTVVGRLEAQTVAKSKTVRLWCPVIRAVSRSSSER